MEIVSGLCGRCGRLADVSTRDRAISRNSFYCGDCMDELRKELQKGNICSLCRCEIWDGAPRFVLPSRLYSSYFFDRLPVGNRLMCVSCYRSVERIGIMNDPLAKLGSIRSKLGKSTVKKSAGLLTS